MLRSKLSAEDRAEMLISLATSAEDEQVQLKATLAIIDRTDGKVTDKLEITSDEMTPEEYAEELAVIAREHLRSLPDEERIKLLTDPVPSNSIQ